MSAEDKGKRCPNCAWAFWTARNLGLPPRERLVFFAIAERVDADLHCAPTMDELCADTGLTRRTIWAAVHDLAGDPDNPDPKGCIRIEKRRDGLHYFLLRPAEAHRKPKLQPLVRDDQPEVVAPVSQTEVQNLHSPQANIPTPEVQNLHITEPVPVPRNAEFAQLDVQNLPNPLMKYPQESPKDCSLRSQRARESEPKPGSDDDPGFAEFWSNYPRKDDKGHARKAWVKACKKATPARIVAGLLAYQFQESPQYRPYPATWLNGERWLAAGDADTFDPVLRAVGLTPADFANAPPCEQPWFPLLQ